MQAPFSLFLALRYLQPKRTFVSIITVISLLGVALGVLVLVVVISVMTGFEQSLQKSILGFEPHMRVTNHEILWQWRDLLPKIKAVPGVVAAAPYVQGPVLIEHEGRVDPAVIRGIDGEQEKLLIPGIEKKIRGNKGSLTMESDSVILGKTLAAELGAQIGDEVTIYAPGNIKGILDELRRESDDPKAKQKTLADLKQDVVIPAPFKVVGYVDSGMNSFDANFILVPLYNAQELYALKDGVQGISVQTVDAYTVDKTRERLNAALDGAGYGITWFDENSERFEAVQMERQVMFIILSFIVLVAAFSIMNTLITVTVQKTREIGIMKALGARAWQIVWVFLSQGMIVGASGTLSGMGAGLLLLHYRNPFRNWLSHKLGIKIFSVGIYEFEGIPAVVRAHDMITIGVGAFVICSLAALVPAWFAARLDPVKALRTE